MIIPSDHGIEILEAFNEHSGFFHIAKANGTFNPLKIIGTTYFFNLCNECFGYLKIIDSIKPPKTHFRLSLLVYFDMINDGCNTPYRFFSFKSQKEAGFGIFKNRIFFRIHAFKFVVDQRRNPVTAFIIK